MGKVSLWIFCYYYCCLNFNGHIESNWNCLFILVRSRSEGEKEREEIRYYSFGTHTLCTQFLHCFITLVLSIFFPSFWSILLYHTRRHLLLTSQKKYRQWNRFSFNEKSKTEGDIRKKKINRVPFVAVSYLISWFLNWEYFFPNQFYFSFSLTLFYCISNNVFINSYCRKVLTFNTFFIHTLMLIDLTEELYR